MPKGDKLQKMAADNKTYTRPLGKKSDPERAFKKAKG